MPLQILYVDDEELLLDIAKEFLESDPDIMMDTAGSAEEAIGKMGRKCYDLILSDYQMWPVDGIALLKDIRNRGDQIPFILFTGKGREEIVIEALNNGADFYIQKGGDTNALFAELRHKIKVAVQRRLQQEKILQYDNIVQQMNFGLMVFKAMVPNDLSTLALIDANPWVLKTFGAFGVDPIGMRAQHIFSREDVPKLISTLAESVAKGESVTINQIRYPDPDGKDRYFSVTAFPLADDSFGVILSDVTGIVLANADLIDNEHKFRAMFNNSRLPSAVLDADTHEFEEINDQWVELYGYTLQELQSRKITMPDLSAQPALTRESVNSLRHIGELHVPIRYHRHKNGSVFPVEIAASSFTWKGKVHVNVFIQDISERIRSEEVLRKQILQLVSPGGDISAVDFEDLFDLEEIQNIQDTFARATGVASLITRPDGTPITRPSNFCSLCHLIRRTAKGLENCRNSDTAVGKACISGSKIQRCLSGGLWDSGISIMVGDKHVANWLIGQVMDKEFDEGHMLAYCHEIGADEVEFRRAMALVPRMSLEQFQQVVNFLSIFAVQMANMALQNIKQARYIIEKDQVRKQLEESEWRFKEITTSSNDIIAVLDPETLTVRSVNECLRTVLGLDPMDVEGKRFTSFIGLEDRPELLQRLMAIRNDPGKAFDVEVEVTDPQGARHTMELHAVVRRNLHGDLDLLTRVKDVTGRMLMEEKLRQSEELYRGLVNASPDGIVISDLEGKIRFLSPAARSLLAIPPEQDVIGDSILRVVEPQSMEAVQANLRALVEGGKVDTQPYRLRRLDGKLIWCEIRATVFHDDEGRPRSFMSLMRDISEKLRVEEEIEESQKRLKLALDVAGEGFFIYDMAEKKATYSEELLRIIGYDKAEVGSDYGFWSEHIHQDDFKGWQQTMEDIDSASERALTEYRLKGKDGAWKWYESQAMGIKDAQGRMVRIIGVVKDINERKRNEHALQVSERHYRELVENASEAITIIQDGKFVLVNRKGVEMTGYSREELLANSPFSFVFPEDLQTTKENHLKMLRGVPRDPYVIRLVTRTGDIRWTIINGVLIDWNGSPAVLNFYNDITEQRKGEEAVRMANRKLNLLSSITRHDILNQLTMLMGFMELERTGKQRNEANFQKMKQAARNIERQISFSKDYESMGVKSPEWQTLDQVFLRAQQQLSLEHVRLEVDAAGWQIFADPLLEKVFYNLLENSLRYAQHLKQITLKVDDSHSYLEITYGDDGVGIAAQDRDRLFEKGYGKNTGYGLFLAREILSLTGISITENGNEQGARFQLLVPPGHFRRA